MNFLIFYDSIFLDGIKIKGKVGDVMEKSKKKGRGENPSIITKMMLAARAGGRCEFKGCNKKVFSDDITLLEANLSNVAHIIASSPEGPRGDDRSNQLSKDLENLMLLCPAHHKLIDDNPHRFSEEELKEMKRNHEQKVSDLLDYMNCPLSIILILNASIKNKKDVRVDFDKAKEANLSAGFCSERVPITISINNHYNYRDEKYWQYSERELIDNIDYHIKQRYFHEPGTILSVFPLGPIPLIIKLGYLLGDSKTINIFQKTRIPDSWTWKEKNKTNDFEVSLKKGKKDGTKVALVLSLTSTIETDRITDVIEVDTIYEISASVKGVDCIKSLEDLKTFGEQFQSVCDDIKNFSRANAISLFPAIPVSAAFEIGRRYMVGVYPKIDIYDEDNGFFKTISIGDDNNE